MKAKITLRQVFTLELDGKPIHGEFTVESDWQGMIALKCSGPCATVIINAPPMGAVDKYEILPRMLGGNKPNGEPITFEAEVVRQDVIRPEAVSEVLRKRTGPPRPEQAQECVVCLHNPCRCKKAPHL